MTTQSDEEKIGAFQILLVALSVYVLLALAAESFMRMDQSTRTILMHVDNVICLVFIYDFFNRMITSPNKLRFLRWGWIDLVSSIPALPVVRVGRAVRVIRVLRLLRGFRSVKTIAAMLFAHRAKGALAATAFICALVMVFSSVAILQVEDSPGSNIQTPEDALWWSIATITTVGYGDRFPVTAEGRLIGSCLMISGVGLFSVLSGAFAVWFLGGKQAEREIVATEEKLSLLGEEIRSLQTEIRRLSASLELPERDG